MPGWQPIHDLLERVKLALPPGIIAHLVGGAVRDVLLSRPTHDLDFVVPGEALSTSRRLADALGGAYYPLDTERDTGRVVLIEPDGSRQILDFAARRGTDLESDLRARDFTINAMAVSVDAPEVLLDPLGGAADLRAKALRACSPTAFQDDPLRILRGVRLAADFGFHILPETRKQMRQAVSLLPRVSAERMRDEVFRILDGPKPGAALRALDRLGALETVLPELPAMKGVTQSPPHVSDVWNHTLDVLQKLESVLNVLALEHNPEVASNLTLGLISLRLGRYREQIHAHLENRLNPLRSNRSLLFLAGLYHDAGKPLTRSLDENGRIRFFEHEVVGAEMVAKRASELHLSNDEIEHLKKIVRNHMRPFLLAQTGQRPTRRAIYRFFRDTGPAGVDVCLLSLADALGTYGAAMHQDVWATHLDIVRSLLEAWWEQPAEAVYPPALVKGDDLMQELELKPGPLVGRLLEAIREGQAAGEIQDRRQALELAREILSQG